MKVLIINSPLFREKNLLYDEDSLPPIGLGYIATHLKNNGINVSLIDAVDRKIPLSELVALINQEQPECIAVNIFTTNYELVKEMIESISYKAHIIIGGLSTKELHKKIIEWKTSNHIDIVTGDGELITLDLVNNVIEQEPLIAVDNRRVFNVGNSSKYLLKDISDIELDRSFFLNEPVRHPLGFLEGNIVTSRGCIYNCTFCAAARSLNGDYPIREKSEISIIRELTDISEKFPGVDSIRVLDDLFLKKKETVEKAARIFSQFNFQWRSMAHVMTFHKVDDQLMTALKESGCHELFIGIESGSPKILSSIKKTNNIELIVTNLTKVLKAGINLKGYFIYGFPDETVEDMEMTFQLASTLKAAAEHYGANFRTSVFQYRPYHGTQIYYELKQKGADVEVEAIMPNQALSHLVGRLQFNFHSGNYSMAETNQVHDYIYRTINLNGGEIFGQLGAKGMRQSYL